MREHIRKLKIIQRVYINLVVWNNLFLIRVNKRHIYYDIAIISIKIILNNININKYKYKEKWTCHININIKKSLVI